ncbi:MAG: hypothetical protein QN174_09665 [Armatimonadota bacterium]|nr:hypothetical protein [Armatimonadota bacterium]MDR7422797.1 hypothetical protein [Armatimonadota bacterium]MDR7453343.1 hypothetical protein [Armatimonadota bacterium]MDR7457029.1 hypothetical protein [Armatimonadota bacterium]MDR7497211.1 hypothetical protein [Armatimonadota bacterium]
MGYVAAAYTVVVGLVLVYALTLVARQRFIDEMAEAAGMEEAGR